MKLNVDCVEIGTEVFALDEHAGYMKPIRGVVVEVFLHVGRLGVSVSSYKVKPHDEHLLVQDILPEYVFTNKKKFLQKFFNL